MCTDTYEENSNSSPRGKETQIMYMCGAEIGRAHNRAFVVKQKLLVHKYARLHRIILSFFVHVNRNLCVWRLGGEPVREFPKILDYPFNVKAALRKLLSVHKTLNGK